MCIRVRDIRDQLAGLLERVQIELISTESDLDAIKKSITSGFFPHSARLQKKMCIRVRDIRDQLAGLLERVQIELISTESDLDAIKKSITSGFFPHSARLQKKMCIRVRDIRDQLAGLLERVQIELISTESDLDAIKKSITSGFFPHSARLQKKMCIRVRDIRDQLAGLLERVQIELISTESDLDAIKKSITSGFFPHSARLQKKMCIRVRDIRDQLAGLLERVQIELISTESDLDAIKKSITSGFFPHSARLQKKMCIRVRDIRDQLAGLLERVQIELISTESDLDAIKKSITSGFFPHSARLQKKMCIRVRDIRDQLADPLLVY
ncbi:pre-mRNA-splicing factor ATP-dependent RNA helicase DHX16 [Vigna unguiculata]|uniref:Pre-mRNA-splicing factor ATP-dependent RNA helicase DHX16 n=1 Tax=Vigna unguiculata TaxID=3917 RepID=A0A4D6NM44_VIGUN|nr:pre-mRNA-splicing factor ATP-dependent RNA helicase DHX16 [Vigna unguiculata]